MIETTIEPMGDSAVMIRFGDRMSPEVFRRIRQFVRLLDEYSLPAIEEYVPAYTSVLVYYDVIQAVEMMEQGGVSSPYEAVARWCEAVLKRVDLPDEQLKDQTKLRSKAETVVDIPVCYGGEYGPDLEFVSQYNGLTPEEVVRIHAETEYFAYMVGFLPGFPYLGGLSERIATPRRESPRLEVPAGSVGIAGSQTGIYPLASPGGWQLIGRTPLTLFRPEADPPVLVKPGDKVRFKPVTAQEYQHLLTAGELP